MRCHVLALVFVSSCMSSSLVPCGDLVCPVGNVCVQERCASPEAVLACDGKVDADECTVGGLPGECRGGACIQSGCGNGLIDGGEVCDDSNIDSGDGCRADCLKVEMCGDGEIDQGEACDDGNTNNADGCDACVVMSWQATVSIGATRLATRAGLAQPRRIAADQQGNLYVTTNGLLRRVDPGGFITTIAGSTQYGFGGDGGPATNALLGRNDSVAVDHLDNIYLGELGRIRRIDANGVITTIAGTAIPGFSGDDGLASSAQVGDVTGIAVDGLGQVYAAAGNRVRRIDTFGVITTVAGNGTLGFTGDGQLATSASINAESIAVSQTGTLYIAGDGVVRRVEANGNISTVGSSFGGAGFTGIAIDAAGYLYVSDANVFGVSRVDPTGGITVIAGSGTQGFSGDGGPALDAQLSSPWALAVDDLGNLFVADAFNGRVRRVDTAGLIVTIAGNGAAASSGVPVDSAAGEAATGNQLVGPRDVTVDPTGRPVISDEDGHRILRVEAGIITTIAGNTNEGFSGDGGPALAAQLSFPNTVTVDANSNVFIGDELNKRIRRVNASGTLTTIAGTGSFGLGGNGGPADVAQVDDPQGLAIDNLGRLVLSEFAVVRRIDADGAIRIVAGTPGTTGYGGDNGPALSAVISANDVAIDAQGNIYLAEFETNRVRRVDVGGTITTVAGTGAGTYNGDNIAASSATLFHPYSVACGPNGVVFVNDRENNRIRRIAADQTITTIAGVGVRARYGDGGLAINAAFDNPAGMAADAAGNLYIADYNAQVVRRIDAVTQIITTVAGHIDPSGTGPLAIAALPDPRAFVITPSFTVFAGGRSGVVELARGSSLEVAAGRYPQSQATGSLARYRDNNFGSVGGVAFDTGAGKLYLTESGCIGTTCTYRIQVVAVVDPANVLTWTIAPLSLAAGTPGFANGPVATSRFRAPEGLWLDAAAQKLYVADTGNHAVRVIDLSAGTVTTFAGTPGVRGTFGDGGPATSAELFAPTALTTCPNGDVFIADTGNHRIRRVTAGGVISTVLGNGVPSSLGDGAPATSYPIDAPRGLACDAGGNLYITSRTTVRLLPAAAGGAIDGSGSVTTIYGGAPRDTFPARSTSCLTGIAIVDATHLQVADSCAGMLVALERVAQ